MRFFNLQTLWSNDATVNLQSFKRKLTITTFSAQFFGVVHFGISGNYILVCRRILDEFPLNEGGKRAIISLTEHFTHIFGQFRAQICEISMPRDKNASVQKGEVSLTCFAAILLTLE